METPKLRTLSVLLVNDALEEREEYARILRISGYRAVEAATFAAAYQIATKNSVDIVVTDVRIGGSISGLELTRRLRNDTRTAAVPIIVLTTVSRPQDGDIAIKAGADSRGVSPRTTDDSIRAISWGRHGSGRTEETSSGQADCSSVRRAVPAHEQNVLIRLGRSHDIHPTRPRPRCVRTAGRSAPGYVKPNE